MEQINELQEEDQDTSLILSKNKKEKL